MALGERAAGNGRDSSMAETPNDALVQLTLRVVLITPPQGMTPC